MVDMFAKELANDARGLAVLAEWLGSGGVPVSSSQANNRALICLTCPENREKGWWDKVKNHIAFAIKEHLLVKSKLGLRVAVEDELAMCRKCGCAIPLLVWTPAEHLKKHHTNLKDYPSFCWKRQEIELL